MLFTSPASFYNLMTDLLISLSPSYCLFLPILLLLQQKYLIFCLLVMCRRTAVACDLVSATWGKKQAASASTCIVRSPNRSSSSEQWRKALQHREQVSERWTGSSRCPTHTPYLQRHRAHIYFHLIDTWSSSCTMCNMFSTFISVVCWWVDLLLLNVIIDLLLFIWCTVCESSDFLLLCVCVCLCAWEREIVCVCISCNLITSIEIPCSIRLSPRDCVWLLSVDMCSVCSVCSVCVVWRQNVFTVMDPSYSTYVELHSVN